MLSNKKLPALLIYSTIIGSLLVGCTTTDEPAPTLKNLDVEMNTELLRNGQFAYGYEEWWISGAELTVEQEEACINVTNPGSKPWNVTLGQGGAGLVKGASYALEFTARSNVETTFRAVIQHDGAPYTQYLNKEIPVTRKSAPFTFVFTQQEESDPKVQLQMQLGAEKPAIICFRNVSLKSNYM